MIPIYTIFTWLNLLVSFIYDRLLLLSHDLLWYKMDPTYDLYPIFSDK